MVSSFCRLCRWYTSEYSIACGYKSPEDLSLGIVLVLQLLLRREIRNPI
jgi:hypothetical protein